MIRITFGNSETGKVETLDLDVGSIGITYNLIRDDNDNVIAQYGRTHGLWERVEDDSYWTDIDVSPM
jgi:hypothetical protein